MPFPEGHRVEPESSARLADVSACAYRSAVLTSRPVTGFSIGFTQRGPDREGLDRVVLAVPDAPPGDPDDDSPWRHGLDHDGVGAD